MYSNLVLAVPHAVGEVSIPALAKEATVKAWVARWTDWATDVLFGGKTEGDSRITMVKARYSRIQVDVERLEGEMDRIAAFTLPDKGGVAFELSDGLRNAYLSEWFRYRAALLQTTAQGDNPLIIDCHSFPADLAPEIDVCLGFNEDASKPSDAVIQVVASLFMKAGYHVALNQPYSNAIAPIGYCGHSLMIELNKQTYWNEVACVRGIGFEKIQDVLQEVYSCLLGDEM